MLLGMQANGELASMQPGAYMLFAPGNSKKCTKARSTKARRAQDNLENDDEEELDEEEFRKTVQTVFHLPISDAASRLGMGVTVLKKQCRKIGIPRWPYRKLASIEKLIESVEKVPLPQYLKALNTSVFQFW